MDLQIEELKRNHALDGVFGLVYHRELQDFLVLLPRLFRENYYPAKL
jgi:hypothetical protein